MIFVRRAAIVAVLSLAPAFVNASDMLRPEIGKPLQAAQDLLKHQKYREALAQVDAADAVAGQTPYERFIIGRMRGAAALGAGDPDLAARAFTAVFATGQLSKDEMMKASEAVSIAYYRNKQYTKVPGWIHNYDQYGGTDPAVDQLLTQADYLGANYADAARELRLRLDAKANAGQKPAEEELQLLSNCAVRQKDEGTYQLALEQLLSYYPKKEYWLAAIAGVQRQAGFSERLRLDVYRLKRATATLAEAADYVEMAEMSLQAGFPAEAKQVLVQGYESRILGIGSEAARQQRLRILAERQAVTDRIEGVHPADADAKVNSGYALVLADGVNAGITLMQEGIAQGGLKHPDEARIHLGEALLAAGRAMEAAKAFAAVQGSGAKGLAKLWGIQANRKV